MIVGKEKTLSEGISVVSLGREGFAACRTYQMIQVSTSVNQEANNCSDQALQLHYRSW